MKLLILLFSAQANAGVYEYKGGLALTAPSYKEAAKKCYYLLNPEYINEDKALTVIDICSNPVKGEIK